MPKLRRRFEKFVVQSALNFVLDSLTTSTNRKIITLGSKVSTNYQIKIPLARIACLCFEQAKKNRTSAFR